MAGRYITSEEHLPEDPEGEVTLQMTDAETKEIFTSRADVARSADALADPEPLTVVRGPHENSEEQWYVDVKDADEGVDETRLREILAAGGPDTNVINTRSDPLAVVLTYLVETGEFASRAEAARSLMFAALADERPQLLETYDRLRGEYDPDAVRNALDGA